MPSEKRYNVKVYDQDGTSILKTLSPVLVRNPVRFRSRINGGLGELVLDLALPFDDFDEGASVNFLNVVDVYAVSPAHPLGRRIYRGFVSHYDPKIDRDGNESVQVTALGLASLLTQSYYGTQPSYSVSHSGDDPEDIAQAVIDNFNASNGLSLLDYAGTTDPVGTNVTKDFTERKWFDALSDAKDLAGTGWWWRIDADGSLHFKAKPGSATHTFTIGKDVQIIDARKDSERVVNEVIVERTGSVRTRYADAPSIAAYGLRTVIIKDSTIGDVTTADQRGNKELNDRKDPKAAAVIEVNDNYDIESIQPGDTCKIANLDIDSSLFTSNMQIVGVDYSPDGVTLQLEELRNDLGIELERFVN